MQEIGRLLFTRKSGESFVIGDDTHVTLKKKPRELKADVEIRVADQGVRTLVASNREPFNIGNIPVELTFDHGKGNAIRVLVVAPKSIRILRSELLNAPKKDKAYNQ